MHYREYAEQHVKTVCLCNSTVAWGGGEKWHFEAACAFAARGWRVLLLCHPHGALYAKAVVRPELQVIPFTISRFSFLNPLKKREIAELLGREQVDSVIMNLPADLKCVTPAAREAGVRHIVYRRGSAIAVKNSWLNRWLYGQLSALIVNSEETRRLVLVNNAELIAEEKIHVLPNAVAIDAFDAALSQVDANAVALLQKKATCALEGKPARRPFIIGNAGRLNRQKGQHFLIYLARALEDRQFPFHVFIAGCGEREGELQQLSAGLGVAHRVTFLGFCENLAPFWRTIDLFVLTSLWEGFGYVLLEAMLARKPVFSFSVSNIPELIREGENGRLFSFPEGDNVSASAMEPMADAVVALAADSTSQERMGMGGRAFASSRFSLQAAMDRLEAILA